MAMLVVLLWTMFSLISMNYPIELRQNHHLKVKDSNCCTVKSIMRARYKVKCIQVYLIFLFVGKSVTTLYSERFIPTSYELAPKTTVDEIALIVQVAKNIFNWRTYNKNFLKIKHIIRIMKTDNKNYVTLLHHVCISNTIILNYPGPSFKPCLGRFLEIIGKMLFLYNSINWH